MDVKLDAKSQRPHCEPLSQEPAGRGGGGGGEAHIVVSNSVTQVEAVNSELTVAAEEDGGGGDVDLESLAVQEDSEVAEMLRGNEVPG